MLTVVLDGVDRAETNRLHCSRLADPVRPLDRLHLNRWIPPRVAQKYCASSTPARHHAAHQYDRTSRGAVPAMGAFFLLLPWYSGAVAGQLNSGATSCAWLSIALMSSSVYRQRMFLTELEHSPCDAHWRLRPSPPARRLSRTISTSGFVLKACSIALR